MTDSLFRIQWFMIAGLICVPAAAQPVAPQVPPDAAKVAAPAADAQPAEPARAPGPSPLELETASSSVRFGFLAQPQYEATGGASADGLSHNLYVRRARLMVGGTLFNQFELLFDTDFVDLFKSDAMGVKNGPSLFIQDVVATWNPVDEFKVDAGLMLPPLAHNALQAAETLYSWDYFTYSFRHSNVFRSELPPAGRDAGVQVRGLLLGGHVEYRLGLFQGLRHAAVTPTLDSTSEPELASDNIFRMAGRLQLNVFDSEPGFFYAGSYLGTKKILSFGAAADVQSDYRYWAVDAFLDLPLWHDAITAQVNFAQWDGDPFISALPKQSAIMAEAGYRFSAIKVSPIVRFEQLIFADAEEGSNVMRLGGGAAFWIQGHNTNLKLFYTRVRSDDDSYPNGWHQVNLQLQYFVF